MKTRLVLCTALAGVAVVVPTAAARPQAPLSPQRVQTAQGGIATGVATSIAAEIAKEGIKAAVAKWAPDYYKYVDPTGAALAQIQAQLAEINNKLTQLIDHQYALEAKLNCAIQRTALNPALNDVRAWFNTLRDQRYVTNLTARQANFEALFSERHRMLSAQHLLHNSLIGPDGVIRACAQHIEEGLRPFLSTDLAAEVHDFYAIYHTASAELLIVRANMMALHPENFPAGDAENSARHLQTWWTEEGDLIKPAFPDHLMYDTQSQHIWLSFGVPHGWYLRETYQQSHWHFTGYATTPTCSAVQHEFHKSGHTGWSAINYMAKHRIIRLMPGTDTILCFDDHDRLHEFDIATGTYRYAGDVQSYAQSVAARANVINGQAYVQIHHYSYLNR